MLKAVLFDLDGTLLPMDQDAFVDRYFSLLCKKMAPCGYEPKALIKAVWGGTNAMVTNDGSCRNEEAFWRFFLGVYGEEARAHIPLFEEFYANEFQQAKTLCGFTPKARETVRLVRDLDGGQRHRGRHDRPEPGHEGLSSDRLPDQPEGRGSGALASRQL